MVEQIYPFRCPICRKEVALINGDVRNFPKHNMIENLIRILTLNKEKETKLCDGCGNRGNNSFLGHLLKACDEVVIQI